jgi:hypothetical protein
MVQSKQSEDAAAWRAATWEGATREAMRRWAKLPLERIVAAQEEMWELAEELNRQENPTERDRRSPSHGR